MSAAARPLELQRRVDVLPEGTGPWIERRRVEQFDTAYGSGMQGAHQSEQTLELPELDLAHTVRSTDGATPLRADTSPIVSESVARIRSGAVILTSSPLDVVVLPSC